MPFSLFWDYYKAIEVLKSEEALDAIQYAISDDLKHEKRKELIMKHQAIIKMKLDRTEGKQGNIEDVAKAFARMGELGERKPNNN